MRRAEGPPYRILAIDDDPAALEILRVTAESEGFAFRGFGNQRAGLAALGGYDPDVVCLDAYMPDADGFEACGRLKSDPQTRLLPVLIVTSASDPASMIRGIEAGADDFITKPVDRAQFAARVHVLSRVGRLNRDLEDSEQVIKALAVGVESRDPTTGDHCERVGDLATSLGQRMGLSYEECHALNQGGFLHDIGKIGVPDSVLLKRGPLTEMEQSIMRRHPEIGQSIVKPLRSLKSVLSIVRHHHERWDGKGYPDRLRGDDSPLIARVFQIADAFDALTNRRPYREPLGSWEALRVLEDEAGEGKWDPDVANEFLEMIANGLAR